MMKFETKFNIGDEILIESFGILQKNPIINITIDVDEKTGVVIEYWTVDENSGEWLITDEKNVML